MFDIAKYEQKVDKLIANQFNCFYMSNSKWLKIFRALDCSGITLERISLKKVTSSTPYITYMPKSEDLEPNWVSEGSNELNYFYKEIEWVEFLACYKPSNIPTQYVYQSIDKVSEIITNIGQFEFINTNNGLKLFGYKKT